MMNDLILILREIFPDLRIERLPIGHRTDDDNVWYLGRRGHREEVQVDTSPGGAPPFELERRRTRVSAESVREAASKVTEWLA
ncbi:hypothetical protein [Actinoplanes sp. L3-i22]|uniref:hypothetical protein n=1 Tax=Actinoplanes sp. L3-i22 TaxID=2836373 RepID=UPI001C77C266|nr:hypothetical protein [Actinoplanes sp. L3-i22]BCY12109.1 hypothetical protein L3i22_071970 [Actinoplanes sp. L3-i22]